MSGIAGLLRLDGAPVDAEVLRRMADALASRGPDGGGSHTGGPIGLAVSLLHTTAESAGETQPATLDGRVWVAADARIDAREELARALRGAGRHPDLARPDAELVLHAYAAWGTACVERLLGDFALALWDAPRRRLLLARDRFGIKPLYHARAGEALVFGNTLAALLRHPGVPAHPDEATIGDFLALGLNLRPEATSHAAIRALPPACRLVAEDGRMRVDRYWEPPLEGELRLRRPEEYAEAFRETLREAVADRLRMPRATVLLSGGRDSTAIAATARGVLGAEALTAHTLVYDRLIPDRERHWSGMAARALGIAQRVHPLDDLRLFERWDDPALWRPEPLDAPVLAIDAALFAAAAKDARVALTGEGGDPLLAESRSRLARLLAAGRGWTALREAAAYARVHRRLPRPGFRTLAADRRGERWSPPLPEWIRPELARRLELAARVREAAEVPPSAHPLRPETHGRLLSPYWAHWFAQYDPGATGLPLEFRHPYLDARVVALVLSIPPAQWYNDKGLLRLGMRGLLPEALRARPKTPLAGDPLRARVEGRGERLPEGLRLGEAVRRYVDAEKVPRFAGGAAPDRFDSVAADLRPIGLSLWLERLDLTPEPGAAP